jgi:hypothetical protein
VWSLLAASISSAVLGIVALVAAGVGAVIASQPVLSVALRVIWAACD